MHAMKSFKLRRLRQHFTLFSFDSSFWGGVLFLSLKKLNPIELFRNPVMFSVEVASFLALFLLLKDYFVSGHLDGFSFQIVFWMWLTVFISNFAESFAEGRGKAHAHAFKQEQADLSVKRLRNNTCDDYQIVLAHTLKAGDLVLVEQGDIIPRDGVIEEGIASVDESAITGESAPVIRESNSDFSEVTGGTRVLSDHLIIRVLADEGESFYNHMIDLIESAVRRKTPNELSLTVLLTSMSLIFFFVVATIPAFAFYAGGSVPSLLLVALFVTLVPSTIAALLSAIGIAGMDRLFRFNVIAFSGRAVELAGDIDTLLLDKTGTITKGNRRASALLPVRDVAVEALAEVAMIASLGDETPEGKSIVYFVLRQGWMSRPSFDDQEVTLIPFSAQTRMSGVDIDGCFFRKGAVEAVLNFLKAEGHEPSSQILFDVRRIAQKIARDGGTPLLVIRDFDVLGVVHLRDVIKRGIRERFAGLRKMGIRTIMVTGDNPLTAAAVAAEAGVDDFVAEATPEDKLELIRSEQAKGRLVAMCGDGTNDAPALAQADVGVAMQQGTQVARDASNMVDLDSDPTKLIEIVMIGKQLLMTRGSLMTFSIANDVAKYFAIIPALFASFYPGLAGLNVMNLASPHSAILSATIFNALVILLLLPMSMRGVRYRAESALYLLKRHLLLFGVGGIVLPFACIKLIDLFLIEVGLV